MSYYDNGNSGFHCPECGSWDTDYIPGSMEIECNSCGNVWNPGEDEDDD